MNNLYSFEDFLNEEVHIRSNLKLRDAIHDIVTEELEYGEEMDINDLSKRLYNRFNIKVSSEILKKMIFDDWWKKTDKTLFREKDKKWLDIWPYRNTVERKKKHIKSPLGKSRRKIEKEENLKSNNFYNNRGYYYDQEWMY